MSGLIIGRTYSGDDTKSDELSHHGIKGQKWGVRNGPPYPLHQLSQYNSEKLTNNSIKIFKSQAPQLSHVRINKNTNGDLYSQNGNIVGMVNTEKKSDGHIWIQGLEVYGDNQGKGLGTQLLDHAVNDLNADRLSVNKKNTKAKSLYDKFGFNVYDEDDTMYYMQYSNSKNDISKQNFDKLNEVYKSMPLKDRQFIDPDSTEKPQDYYPSFDKYKERTAYNDISDNGFVIAEKIPKNQNVDDTRGVEIGIGVKTKNQGIGTSLTKGLVDWFNSQDEYDTMWWPVDKANGASIRIAEKNGFVKDPLGDDYIYATDDAYKKLSIDNVSHSSTLFGTRIYRGV